MKIWLVSHLNHLTKFSQGGRKGHAAEMRFALTACMTCLLAVPAPSALFPPPSNSCLLRGSYMTSAKFSNFLTPSHLVTVTNQLILFHLSAFRGPISPHPLRTSYMEAPFDKSFRLRRPSPAFPATTMTSQLKGCNFWKNCK